MFREGEPTLSQVFEKFHLILTIPKKTGTFGLTLQIKKQKRLDNLLKVSQLVNGRPEIHFLGL